MEPYTENRGLAVRIAVRLAKARMALVALGVVLTAVLSLDTDATPLESAPTARLRGARGVAGGETAFHLLAVILGLVGGIMVVIAVALAYGFTTSAAVDGLTLTTTEFYAGLAIVGAIFSEVFAREWA